VSAYRDFHTLIVSCPSPVVNQAASDYYILSTQLDDEQLANASPNGTRPHRAQIHDPEDLPLILNVRISIVLPVPSKLTL
jgi:hypothetical protein